MLLLKLLCLLPVFASLPQATKWKKCDPNPKNFPKMTKATKEWFEVPADLAKKAHFPEHVECAKSGSKEKCCFDPAKTCGKYDIAEQQVYAGIPKEAAKQKDGFCRDGNDCGARDFCNGFACCFNGLNIKHNIECPYPSVNPTYPKGSCTDDKQCDNQKGKLWSFCVNIVKPEITKELYIDFNKYKGCCQLSTYSRCIGHESIILVFGSHFSLTTEEDKEECLRTGNQIKKEYAYYWCCPNFVLRIGPLTVQQEIIWPCDVDKECNGGKVCMEYGRVDGKPLTRLSTVGKIGKTCAHYPKCAAGDEPEVTANRLVLCKHGKDDPCYTSDPKRIGFCENDYHCCPLHCPYYTGKNRATGTERPFAYSFPDAKGQCHGDRVQLTDVPNQGKLCCKHDDIFDCPLNQSPALENLRKPTNNSCPPESYQHSVGKHCCYNLVSKDLGKKARVPDANIQKTCKKHEECGKDEFCGQSTFAVNEDTFRGVVNHCYPKPTFHGGLPVLLDKTGVNTCKTVKDCNGKDALVCEIPSFKVGGKTITGDKKICFQKACPFGKQPSDPKKTCKDDKECTNGGCFKIIGSAKHCCPIPNNFPLCPPGEFPMGAKDGTPHGDCDSKISQRKVLNGKNYCCPKLHHANYAPVKDAICDANSCVKGQICTVSRRIDGKPTRTTHKQCYLHPKCSSKSNKLVSLRKGETIKCAKDDDCMFKGETPRYCGKNKLCCDLDCPYWNKVNSKTMETCPQGTCPSAHQVCTELEDAGKRCCLVDEPKCPGDQVPVMYEYKVPKDKCPKGSSLYSVPASKPDKKICCNHLQLKDGSSSIVPVEPFKTCGKQSDCDRDEFCDEAEFILDNKQVIGKPKFCFKRPTISVGAVLVDSNGLKKCKTDKDCHGGVDGIVVCLDPHNRNLYGSKLCFQKLCPYNLQPKDATKTCSNDSGCPKKQICTQLGHAKYCCPTAPDYLCPSEQFPIKQTNKKCSADYFAHPTINTFCCPKFISKMTKKFAVDFKKECKKNSDCGSENFCGKSALFKSNKIRGSPMHCYPRPQYDGSFALAEAAKTELITCKVPKDCKTKNPTICEKVEGISLCFEKPCPFGKLPKDPFVPCKDTAGCGNQGSCMKIFEGSKHCCPMEGAEKCANGEMPVLAKDSTIHGDCDTKTSESVKIGGKNFCCPKLVQRFTNQPPKKAKCSSTKKDCDSGDVCEEGKRLDGVARGSQTKQCYARPKCKSGKLALIREDEFLATCTEDKNCILQGDAPGYCEDGFCCPSPVKLCSDKVTPMNLQPKCSEKTKKMDCKQPEGAETACEKGRCCPKVEKGVVSQPFVTEKTCQSALDCPKPLMYCHPKHNRCTHFGSRKDLQTDKPCAKKDSKTCENGGVCVFPHRNKTSLPFCWTDPMGVDRQRKETPQRQTGDKGDDEEGGGPNIGMMLGMIAIVLVLLGAVAFAIFILIKVKASRKVAKEKKKDGKKENKKNNKKKEKIGEKKVDKKEKKQPKSEDKKKTKKTKENEMAGSQPQSVSKDSQQISGGL